MAEIVAPALELTAAEANSPTRWAIEQQKLNEFFPNVKLVGNAGKVTAAVGTLDTHARNTYGIRVELTNFPYSMPRVFVRDYPLHPDTPHKFKDGSLCTMRSDQWRFHFSVAMVLAKTAVWLGKYEIWKSNGHRWPGRGQAH